MLALSRPLVSLDLEATDADPCAAAIVQFGATLWKPDGTTQSWKQDFKPWKPISPEAEEIIGRKTAEFDNCPPFSEWAARIHKALSGKDLLGFNLRRYDLPLLDEELRRCGLRLDLTGVHIVDAFGIYQKKNPRTLADAVRFYCKREPTDQHDASGDSADTLDVFLAQMRHHEDLESMELADLAAFSRMGDYEYVDIAGKLYRDAEGFMRFGFGKNRGEKVLDQMGYCRWMLEKGSFPGSTLEALSDEIDKQPSKKRTG